MQRTALMGLCTVAVLACGADSRTDRAGDGPGGAAQVRAGARSPSTTAAVGEVGSQGRTDSHPKWPLPSVRDDDGKLRVAITKMAYTGSRNVPERSDGPSYLEAGGLAKSLTDQGFAVDPVVDIALSDEQDKEYGEWHRVGLANGNLARTVASQLREGRVAVGLLANCNALMGMLGGVQHSGPDERPARVGLVYIDAHGDFNTPETTLSGMLGGMPVAVSAGLALRNLRVESGLEPPLPPASIVMAGIRDTDPLEQELIERERIAQLSVADVRERSANLHERMRELSARSDMVYVHIDMDVLDPDEVPGHSLTVPDGPTSAELGAALHDMFKYEKVVALGIASTPSGSKDPDGRSRTAAYALIDGALAGAAARGQGAASPR